MRYLLIMLMLMSTPAMALDVVQKKLRATPEMSELCQTRININKRHVARYTDRILARREASTRPPLLDIIKQKHFQAELQNWINYCNDKEEEDE